MSISAVIITFNEERNIARCLDSLDGVADEIVVVDSFSNDRTLEICRSKNVRIVQNRFENYIPQKNFALRQAKFEQVLSLDADEALSPKLRQSILNVKNLDEPAADFSMNRLTNFCGQWIRHSGWYPDRKVRLFDRRRAEWGGTNPHDKVVFFEKKDEKAVQRLEGDLLHFSYYTEAEHLERARKYARIAAEDLFQKGKTAPAWRLVVNPLLKFFRNYFLKMGFLDGRAGLRICAVSALETFWKYRRLRDLRSST